VNEIGKRWAVAGVGVPVVIVLLYFGGWPIALFCALFAGLGAWECYRLAEHTGVRPLSLLGAAVAVGLPLAAALEPSFSELAPLALGMVGTLAVVALVGAMAARGPTGKPLGVVAITLFGALYGGLSLAFVPMLHAMPVVRAWTAIGLEQWGGLLVVALPLAATWIGDAAAFFAGRAWGKPKGKGGLAPSISPNKSWVGAWAGLAGAGAAAVLWWWIAREVLPAQPLGPFGAAAVGVFLGACAILGDLAESLLKREAGVKDSGTVFPGHGGVLDRLDALTFTLPAAYAALAFADALSNR
jgi:phosphatidate cytidylyltransferase